MEITAFLQITSVPTSLQHKVLVVISTVDHVGRQYSIEGLESKATTAAARNRETDDCELLWSRETFHFRSLRKLQHILLDVKNHSPELKDGLVASERRRWVRLQLVIVTVSEHEGC